MIFARWGCMPSSSESANFFSSVAAAEAATEIAARERGSLGGRSWLPHSLLTRADDCRDQTTGDRNMGKGQVSYPKAPGNDVRGGNES